MKKHLIRATSAFGIESLVSYELTKLGFTGTKTHNGYIDCEGDDTDLMKANMWLRCSDRVLWVLDSFLCSDYDDLYDGVKAFRWEDILPFEAVLNVFFSSHDSSITGSSHGQAVTKKAILDALRRKHTCDIFPETGPVYGIEVIIRNDRADLCLNTSGAGLHKRGYRTEQGAAPLKETLAAAMLSISRYRADRPLADPFCGSATIAIEAALMAMNRAPGLLRSFSMENWPHIPQSVCTSVRDEAQSAVQDCECSIYASDNDPRVFQKARANAARAGVEEKILFERKDANEFKSKKKYGCIVTNPPYGLRLGTADETAGLYRELGNVYAGLNEWSAYILSADTGFEKKFEKKADKRRKLYNGKIQCCLYQYHSRMRA